MFSPVPKSDKEKQDFYNKAWELYMTKGEDGMGELFPTWFQYYLRISQAFESPRHYIKCYPPIRAV